MTDVQGNSPAPTERAGANPTIPEPGTVLTAGQLWCHLLALDEPQRLARLARLLDAAERGRLCALQDHAGMHNELDCLWVTVSSGAVETRRLRFALDWARFLLQRLADAAGRYIDSYAEAAPDVRTEIRQHLRDAQHDACVVLQDDPSAS